MVPLLILSSDLKECSSEGPLRTSLVAQDDGDAYIDQRLIASSKAGSVARTCQVLHDGDTSADEDCFVVLAKDSKTAHLHIDGLQQECEIEFVDLKDELHSRIVGLYETEVLTEKHVLVVGLGSGGSPIALELAKAGVGKFTLIDADRLEVHNVVRHHSGLSDLGRFKTKAVREAILEKNPFADVKTFERKCEWEWSDELRAIIANVDLVFCCTDNRPSRLLLNQLCFEQRRICIYGGAFRRAYGGQALRVYPGETICYQCFIDQMPDAAADQEIANADQAEAIAYADRPVAIEPGLSNDIAPISTMCVKLGILELLKGSATSFQNLYDDLTAPWYQWLNRREVGTDYEELPPLDTDPEAPRILGWYGVAIERNPACPVCGDFIGSLAASHGISVENLDTARFGQ